MTQPYIQCLFCDRLYEDSMKCEAYPEGIPAEIWNGSHDHEQAYPEDKGLRFKVKPRKTT